MLHSSLVRISLLFPMLLVGGLLRASDRPNILLICIDDLKPQLGCYGDRLAKTPSIDRLASRGVMFQSAYCNQAVCSPSRNALLTSLRPQTLGIYDLPTNFRKSLPDAITMPQHFLKHGYRTQSLGKIFHVGHGNTDDANSWSVPSYKPKGVGYALKENAQSTKVTAKGKEKGNATESAAVEDEAYADGQIAAEAIQRLKEASKNPSEPFFLAVGFLKPHLPFVAPKRYWDLYDPRSIELPTVRSAPVGAPNYAPTGSGELWAYADMPDKGPLNDDQMRHLIHGYYAATSYTDVQIGKVLDALQDTGLDKNTIVVLWGDHGWHLGDHGMWCKHSNYQQATRIPVIVAAPEGAKGEQAFGMIESVDIFPTLAEMAGLPLPQGIDGKSFAATVRNPQTPARSHVSHVYPRGKLLGRAIRDERYRLVEWKTPGDRPEAAELELYDYNEDPLETRNLASQFPEVVARMRAILSTYPEAKPQIESETNTAVSNNQDRVAMFQKKDLNSDRFLSREEFLRNQADADLAAKRFDRMDRNRDDKLAQEEFVAGPK